MSLEHVQDPVPRLESPSNPDLPDWTTVTRDLASELEAEDRAGHAAAAAVGERYFPNPISPHNGVNYQQCAALLDAAAERARAGSTDPDDLAALEAVQSLTPFFGDSGTSVDYRLERQGP